MKIAKEESAKAIKTHKNATGKTAKRSTPILKEGVVKVKPELTKDLRDFFEDGLKDIYWVEKALIKAMTKMFKNTTSMQLIKVFKEHLKETEEHVTRLKQIFESLGLILVAKKCDAMAGLLNEANRIMEETEFGNVRDAAMIGAVQRVEQYKIDTYGTLRVYAVTIGKTKAVLILSKTLSEAKNANAKLTEIAVS
ncbi:MAG: ferritin-like domain-containing protein [Chryseobacterium sp.]|nr:ferritin-like domain-containing protein [Chryseobacterium sp.]